MNFFLTDRQAALNSLLVATRETNDHYRDAVEMVNEKLKQTLQGILVRRKGFILRLEQAVRESGILPAVPDPDKEAGEMLIHHVGALIKDDYETDIREQRILGEQKLLELVIEAQQNAPDLSSLLNEFTQHISETTEQLKSV